MIFDCGPVILSLKVAAFAVTAVICTALPLGCLMARRDFPGKDILESFITLPLVLPPSVIGFGLLYLFGKHGPVGCLLENWLHIRIVFTWWGAVISSAVVSFPLMYQSVKASVKGVDLNLENAARTLGASEIRIFWTITLPLAWPGVIAGLVMSFARALGEFGATLMVAGNIPGQTQTMPLAIYFAAESGDTADAAILVVIMTLFSFFLIFWLNRWSKKL
ncbi:molybdate ABC transporter permease subunit [Thermincola potens]|uniref:Molybdenum transport system permease n=1 Tax=Thermincola potens (strain JR) TaxID=635013 RepID=D5X9H1_THEPJ|nr:molybdate ABC transporter permease subunit [Thermincola potens]ADG83075.1 molybdate ABC transporter, inner membrane subunit [Thermincola potens JR]